MATIPRQAPITPTTISQFLGINEDLSGETELQLGESPDSLNFRVTDNYKLAKREGYTQLFASLGAYAIKGMWYGKIGGAYHFLFAANGNIYEHDLSAGTNTSIGTLTNAVTFFFAFNNKVYMLNGSEYKYWDGTTFGTVEGYIPLVATATPPSGGGTTNESINQLTGKKHQTFSGDNTATVYQLAETSVDSIDQVYVGGTLQTVTTDYTVDTTAGTVTFTSAPATGVDNVDIYWTKANNDRTAITENTRAMFYGGKNDTRIFFYGDGSNEYYFTGLADGVPSAEYIPVNNYRKISSDEFQVTDIVRQYDRQIIFTDGGESWYSYYDPFYDSSDNLVIDFPTFPLNNTKGNIAKGQAQIINNNPITIDEGVYQWVSTNVRDERNAEYMSKRVQPSLDAEDLTSVVTIDWESKREYWIATGKKVWVYNYRLNVWYKFLLNDTVKCFIVIDDELYFGTDNGQIMKFSSDTRNDNGTTINAYWEMNFYDFEAEWLRKYINEMWIAMKPEDKASVDLTYQTDYDASSNTYTAIYNLSTFTTADFSDWSFKTNYNPQPFRLKIKAKKFVYFKLILTNGQSDEKLTVLSINLPARYGGKAR